METKSEILKKLKSNESALYSIIIPIIIPYLNDFIFLYFG